LKLGSLPHSRFGLFSFPPPPLRNYGSSRTKVSLASTCHYLHFGSHWKMAAELRTLENQGLIQYITDNARWEAVSLSKGSVGGLSLNLSAGETILRYLRGRNLKAPVLVYCGGSIPFTAYVKEFSLAASTCEFGVCRAFMAQLVSAQEAVSEEEGFWSSWALGKGFNLLSC
jgi:hypothetical protein